MRLSQFTVHLFYCLDGAVRKYYAKFNTIVSVLGNITVDMHKKLLYYLSSFYRPACEIWSL